jgi:hypothetical protein
MKHALKNASLLLMPALLLAGCGGTAIQPLAPNMPKPLIVEFPADVGLFYTEDFRKFEHEEERWGAKWEVKLGPSHVEMMKGLMSMAFHSVSEVAADPRTTPPPANLSVVFKPYIDQYSFITPRDSGGSFFAVTIKYRFEVFAPDGRLADTLTLTGYGGALATGFSSSKPMDAATQAAMRDAAAKFLVQFPEQRLAKKMRAGEPLVDETPVAVAGVQTEGDVKIEPVPIYPPSAEVL